MATTTLSSRAFNQDCGRAKKTATTEGPVIITDRGQPSHVLMSYEEYQRITGAKRNLVEALSMPGLSAIELDIPSRRTSMRDVDIL